MAASGAETLISQNRIALKEAGFTDAQTDSYCQLLKNAFDASASGVTMPDPQWASLKSQ